MTKCSECGSSSTYTGANTVECPTVGCKNYTEKQFESVSPRLQGVMIKEEVTLVRQHRNGWELHLNSGAGFVCPDTKCKTSPQVGEKLFARAQHHSHGKLTMCVIGDRTYI